MKKHGVIMVFLLILTLCSIGVVSASDDLTESDFESSDLIQDDMQEIEVGDSELSGDEVESSVENPSVDESSQASLDDALNENDDSNPLEDENTSDSVDGVDEDVYYDSSDEELEDADSDYCEDVSEDEFAPNSSGDVSIDDSVGNIKVNHNVHDDLGNEDLSELDCEIQSDTLDNNYKLGYEIIEIVKNCLDLEFADDILIIPKNNELDKINDKTINGNVLEEIMYASNGYVTYEDNELSTLSSIRTDIINIAFFKRGESLAIAVYEDGNLISVFGNDNNPEMFAGLWKLHSLLAGDESSVDLVATWTNGISRNASLAQGQGHFCDGLDCEQNKIQTLLDYYPPKNNLEMPDNNLLGVPGYSDVDAFIWGENTLGKEAFVGVDDDRSLMGFIGWNSTSQYGMLIMMNDESEIRETYILSSLNPEEDETSLVGMQNESDLLTQNMGEEELHNAVPDLGELPTGQNVYSESYDAKDLVDLTPEQLEIIGVAASFKAIEYFKSQGIDVIKDYQYFYVLTSAGYVKINGRSTERVLKGIEDVFGSRCNHILQLHSPLWEDLVFYFFWIKDAEHIKAYSIKYDVTSGMFVEYESSYEQIEYIVCHFFGREEHCHYHDYCHDYYGRCHISSCDEVNPFERLNELADNIIKDVAKKLSKKEGKSYSSNATANKTSVTNKSTVANNTTVANKTAGVKNATKENNTTAATNVPFKDNAVPASRVSLANIAYTIVAIALVGVVFGVANLRRIE